MTASTNDHLKQELRAAFGQVGLTKIDPLSLGHCAVLAVTLQMKPKAIAEIWDALSVTHNFNALNEHTFTTLRQALIKESDDDVLPPVTSSNSGSVVISVKENAAASSPDQKSAKRPHSVVTPSSKPDKVGSSSSMAIHSQNRRMSLSPKPPMHLSDSARKKIKYEERQGVGTVVATYQGDLVTATTTTPRTAASEPRCRIAWKEDFPTNVQKPYRHLFTPLATKAKALDRQLDRWLEIFQESYAFGQGDLAPLEAVGVPRQELVCCVGRVCSSAHEGRMNATTVLLEGSRATSGGARVEVDLRHLKTDYSLFPGQIVAIEGHNSTGRSLVAQRLCEGAPHPPNTSPAADLLRQHYEVQDGAPLHIVTASGPFTTADNLDYQPLLDLLQNLLHQETTPDVIILTGPFVDMRHGTVATGNVMIEESIVPFEVFFCHKVAQVLEDFYESATHATQFILQPSLDDAIAEWVFPQAPFQDRLSKSVGSSLPGGEDFELGTLGLEFVETINRGEEVGNKPYRRVHCVPNPCTLRINEIVVGITSTDILFHTSTNETNGNLPAGSRLARIAQHMLQQRSYYPLFPASINLDWSQSWEMPCRPDLLVCPSKLSPFGKTVLDSTLVVNPGPLTRDTTGGTYAALEIHPLPRETLESTGAQVALPHNVAQRTRVEVRRI